MAKMTKGNLGYKRNTQIKWAFFTACLMTLFINPKLADPFNAPKLYLLICGTLILLGFLIFGGDNLVKSRDTSTILVIIFSCYYIYKQIVILPLKNINHMILENFFRTN